MTHRITAAVARALRRQPDPTVHYHLDIDGEYVCEDVTCPYRDPREAPPAQVEALRA